MSSLLKLGSAVFGSSITSLALFQKQSFANSDCGPPSYFSQCNPPPCSPPPQCPPPPCNPPPPRCNDLVSPADEPWAWNWDGRQNHPMRQGTRNIFFIRDAHHDLEGRITQLTEKGMQQSQMLGRFLAKFATKEFNLCNMDVRCYHSGVLRAEQTCYEAMKAGLNLNMMMECRLAEGCPMYPNPRFPNYNPCSQDVQTCRNRLNSFVKERMHRSDCDMDTFELYFCHANVARFLTLKLLQMPLSAWSRLLIGHCGITWLKIHPDGRVRCMTFGDTGFFDKMCYVTS